MTDVDSILASGRYTDRRGRVWRYDAVYRRWEGGATHFTEALMRRLISRDQHRDVCKGLGVCTSHPVPHVIASGHNFWQVYSDGVKTWKAVRTLPEAIAAARDMAGAPR